MWQTRKFRTIEAGRKWLAKNGHRIQWQEIFINNVPFAIEYRRLRVIC